MIQEIIQEDKDFKEQLNDIRREELRQLEEIVTGRFEKEAQVSDFDKLC